MKEILVRSQAELDALPNKFDEFTIIKIDCLNIIIRVARENSRVEALGVIKLNRIGV